MDPAETSADKHKYMRLFFALWPDETVRQQLTVLMRQSSQHNHGKPMNPMNLHQTLVFLGNVKADLLPCLQQTVGDIKCERFTLQLDTLGWFKKPRVIWSGSEHMPDQLLALVSQIRAGCLHCGLPVDDISFKVHITLQRKAQHFQPFDIVPIEWNVEDFVLVQSFTYSQGVEYKVIDRWPLIK